MRAIVWDGLNLKPPLIVLTGFWLLTLIGCTDPLLQVDRVGDVDSEGTQGVGFSGGQDTGEMALVTADDIVPFGRLARNCTVRKRDMGTQIDTVSGYNIYDTKPGAGGLHTFFIDGFRDGCTRQLSGALIVFGDVGTHELVRYADVGIDQPYTITDEAYEMIKASFCRVRRTEPCGRRIDRLARTTSFVTIYESFADNARWVDVLLHQGEVIAQEINS